MCWGERVSRAQAHGGGSDAAGPGTALGNMGSVNL